jgi:glucose-6-phosphate 1-dehydrogenase
MLRRLLPNGFSVVGYARREKMDDPFREEMHEAVSKHSRTRPISDAVWNSFAQGLFYCQGEFTDPAGYQGLKQMLEQVERERGTGGNRLFYLATPPDFYAEIIRRLGEAGLVQRYDNAEGPGWTRIIVEKPFGHDLASAQELNRQVLHVFDEQQVYRIDHYLGKETVQNLLVFRFANGIVEPIWNRRYVDHVQITVAESLGVEGRGQYYETAGVIRDIIQNHMLQLLALTAMEPPVEAEANAIRDEKVKALRAIRPIRPDEVNRYAVRGQYGPGVVAGEHVPGYLDEPEVAPDSVTETYVALKLFIDSWRWAGVPFYLRSGKRLPKRVTEIAVQFKHVPLLLFADGGGSDIEPNVLAINIQPDEGAALRFGAKVPGAAMRIRPVTMDFRYSTAFGGEPPEAYERLLLDAMLGDSTLFTRRDEVEVAWQLVTAITEGWQAAPRPRFPNYPAGTWGPEDARRLIEQDGRRWRRL